MWGGGGQRNSGMHRPPPPPPPSFGLLSALPLLPFSPFLSQETPSGLDWKPDLSSPVCMLCWDVPGSLSCSLHSPFIHKHTILAPHPCLWLSLPSPLFSRTLTLSFCFFVSHCLHPEVPSGPLEGQWCNQLLISHRDWQLALLGGGGHYGGSACQCWATSWFNFKTEWERVGWRLKEKQQMHACVCVCGLCIRH